jgi:hypothetical protein
MGWTLGSFKATRGVAGGLRGGSSLYGVTSSAVAYGFAVLIFLVAGQVQCCSSGCAAGGCMMVGGRGGGQTPCCTRLWHMGQAAVPLGKDGCLAASSGGAPCRACATRCPACWQSEDHVGALCWRSLQQREPSKSMTLMSCSCARDRMYAWLL